ncbi:MAG: hypothetical protein ABJN26_19935 [Stappiaceae bacterium]
MRMIGIGLTAFLLAGLALLFSTYDIWQKGRRHFDEFTKGPQLVFESQSAVESNDTHTAVVYRAGPGSPLILSGLPAYQGATFYLPIDARPTSGYLQIDATFQILQGVEGVLRISIDNTRRGEVLLRPGEGGRSLRIPLSSTEIVREKLVVSFSLQGEGPHSACSIDTGYEAVVEIETTSAIYLKTDSQLQTPRDRINAWGRIAHINWPKNGKNGARTDSILLATKLNQQTIGAVFMGEPGKDALDLSTIHSTAIDAFATKPSVTESKNVRFVGQEPVNAGLRRFHGSTTWRVKLDLRDSKTRIPETLDLALYLGRQSRGKEWRVTITLNNRLLSDSLADQRNERFTTTIALPDNIAEGYYSLEIRAASAQAPTHGCQSGPELIAEMLPETRLNMGERRFTDPVVELQNALSASGQASIELPQRLSSADASVAAQMLASFLPEQVSLSSGRASAHIVVLNTETIKEIKSASEGSWLVYSDPNTQKLVAEPALSALAHATPQLGLLVTVTQRVSSRIPS